MDELGRRLEELLLQPCCTMLLLDEWRLELLDANEAGRPPAIFSNSSGVSCFFGSLILLAFLAVLFFCLLPLTTPFFVVRTSL